MYLMLHLKTNFSFIPHVCVLFYSVGCASNIFYDFMSFIYIFQPVFASTWRTRTANVMTHNFPMSSYFHEMWARRASQVGAS